MQKQMGQTSSVGGVSINELLLSPSAPEAAGVDDDVVPLVAAVSSAVPATVSSRSVEIETDPSSVASVRRSDPRSGLESGVKEDIVVSRYR